MELVVVERSLALYVCVRNLEAMRRQEKEEEEVKR